MIAGYSHVKMRVEEKCRSQTSDKRERWNRRGGKSQRGEEKKVRRSEKRKSGKKEDAGVRKSREVAVHCG